MTAACMNTAASAVGSLTDTQLATVMAGQPSDCPGSAQLTNIFSTPGLQASGINGFKFRDGPRGICLAANLPNNVAGYSTAFPSGSARGATFDMDLEKQIGEAMGDEMVASQHTMLLAPVVNVLRHPAWGRAQETYGEDTYELGRLGTAFVQGVQEYVAACAKHYAANNIENGRASDTSQMTDQALHETYGRQFEMIIQDANVAAIMASYNLVQSTDSPTSTAAAHSTENHELLTDMLRTTFGFQGFVLSDWWALPDANASCAAQPAQQASVAAIAVKAGLDMELPWSYNYANLPSVVQTGQVQHQQLVSDAELIVQTQCQFNLLQGNGLKTQSVTMQDPTTYSITNNSAHIALARKAETEAMVLLKNDGNALPIGSSVKKIAVLGATVPFTLQNTDISNGTVNFVTGAVTDNAGLKNTVLTGDLGSSRVYADPSQYVGPLQGITTAAMAKNITVMNGGAAASAAADADLIVVVAGNSPGDEGEDYTTASDRTSFQLDDKLVHSLSMPAVQNPLITSALALGKPTVIVLEGGSVIEMPWLSSATAPLAVIMAWYPGQDGGDALGDLLFGNANFSGKLAVTWPNTSANPSACNPNADTNRETNCFGDEPQFSAGPGLVTKMNYSVGYRYYDDQGTKPLFAFGSGLSYTTYQYDTSLMLSQTTATKSDTVNVQVSVKNTGTMDGDETSFLFVSYPNTKRTGQKSIKELKGFVRTHIPMGQSAMVTIPLRISDLKYWDTPSQSWVWETGPINIMVGGSSDNLVAMSKGQLTLQ
jgi:beta-glucosidase